MAFGRPTMLGMVSLALALDFIVGLLSKFPRRPIIYRGHRAVSHWFQGRGKWKNGSHKTLFDE